MGGKAVITRSLRRRQFCFRSLERLRNGRDWSLDLHGLYRIKWVRPGWPFFAGWLLRGVNLLN